MGTIKSDFWLPSFLTGDRKVEGAALLILVAVGWVLFVGLGAYISSQKNRPAIEGVLLSLIFGPLGIIIAALLPTQSPPAAARPRRTAAQLAAEQEERERRQLRAGGIVDDDQAVSFLDD